MTNNASYEGTRSGNSVENLWQFLRQTFLSNRVFESYEAILDAACDAWNAVRNTPGRITSIVLGE